MTADRPDSQSPGAKPPYVTLSEAAPDVLAWGDLLWGSACGHCVLTPEARVERQSALRVHAAEGLDEVLKRVAKSFSDTGYMSAAVVAARLDDVAIDLALGLCITGDGKLVWETAAVAEAVDPGLGTSALLADGAAEVEVHDVTVLHLFHRSSPAFGHFVLDCLVPLKRFLTVIRSGRLHVLLPSFAPAWMRPILVWYGVPESALWAPSGDSVRCRQAILLSAMATRTTFNPNLALCRSAAKTAMDLVRPSATGRLIYLSRARQTSYSQRTLTNEAALQDLLTARGFEILEPGNMPFADQVRAFAEAEVIVGAHGSGFGNLIFARPGTSVIDIMPSDWPGYWNIDPPAERWLLNLTGAMELDYYLVLCRSRLVRLLSDDDRSGLQKFGMECEVDLDLIARALDCLASSEDAAATKQVEQDIGRTTREAAVEGLDTLCAPALEPLFRLPDRLGTSSGWWGHVPFAGWLVAAACPRRIVELGSYAGVSYFAFCQAVLAEALDCGCHAVDTWQGDAHAGHYDDSVHDDFKRFNDAHYAAISTMHRCTFDEALGRFADGSVDILHIDGLHTYEAVRHDFETWLPKLSDRAVVLFHDANERREGFGVWKFWEEVAGRWPGFLFLHSHGLGVLCVGADAPASVRDLCALDPTRAALLRERMGLIGDRWYMASHFEDMARHALAATASSQAVWQAERVALEVSAVRLAALERSTSWRLTAPLRAAGNAFPGAARAGRRALRVVWWTMTLQLPARLAERRRRHSASRGP